MLRSFAAVALVLVVGSLPSASAVGCQYGTPTPASYAYLCLAEGQVYYLEADEVGQGHNRVVSWLVADEDRVDVLVAAFSDGDYHGAWTTIEYHQTDQHSHAAAHLGPFLPWFNWGYVAVAHHQTYDGGSCTEHVVLVVAANGGYTFREVVPPQPCAQRVPSLPPV